MRYGWVLFLILTVILSLSILAQEGLEKAAEQVFKFTALISVGIVVTMTVYMFAYGTPAIAEIGLSEFLFGQEWRPTAGEPKFGILHMILATLFGCVGAIAIGVPVGLFTAVFLAEVAPKRIGDIIRPAVDLLAGIPSVIYGFIGMKILVPFLREIGVKLGFNTTGSGLAAVIIVLAVMILPTIVRVTETTLRSVPRSYTEAALALGNTKISTIFSVQIPAARSGILAGVILGVGRAIGETMAVIMVAGNIVKFPTLFSSVRPMTAGIAFEMGYAEAGLHRQSLFGIGLVLFVFIMIVNISFSYISKKGGFTGEN
ncbi:MAG: phosphate ABC transporter permease subunit PstC [Clostridiaceae bacterium]|nr:phosphate ABC transporter permease subunit PstC [Clostridiaceae bacterium]